MREETGYQIQIRALLRLVSGYKLLIEVSYVGTLSGGGFHLDPKEVIEARFFAVDELPEGLLPSHRDIIALAFSEKHRQIKEYYDETTSYDHYLGCR